MQQMLLGNILRKNAGQSGLKDKTALIFRNEVLSYGELNARTNRLANGLLDLGVKVGDRVAVLGRNSNTYVAIYFALAKIGAIMVPVNFWYRGQEILYTLRQSGSSGLIMDGRFEEVVAPVRAELDMLEWTLYYDSAPEGGGRSLEDLIESSPPEEPAVDLSENDPHIILYTSGTTGFPKGAALSHKSHYLHAMSLALTTGGHSNDVGIVIYPLFHTGGPDCLVLPHFLTGATLVVLDGGDPNAILDATEQHGVTNIFCVPTVWRWILARQRERTCDVRTVQRCLGSSDTFPPDLLDGILRTFNADVYVTYGLTEAGCILTVCKLTRDDRTKIGSVGRPMPSVELRLVDENGAPVQTGEVGEVAARTPAMMQKYWEMPDKTVESLKGGWLHSGDLGRMDEEGYLFLAGRAGDMIISGGENIYPLEIERLLKENPNIRDVAVVGIPDREWGESVLAVVVPSEGANITPDEVSDFVRTRVAGYKKPKYVEIVDQLPVTTATGKVQKSVLREKYGKKYGTA